MIEANIDIIECGFIRDVPNNKESSVFSSMSALERFIAPKQPGTVYAVMIEQHNYKPYLITPHNENSADLIRLTFRSSEWEDAKVTANELIQKGYKVCIQPVGTASYDDSSLIKLIEDVNKINPYAFYLVDTLGVMYRHEMRKFFYLIDSNLSKNIVLGFHSHNNLQMSFANAQEMIRLNRDRTIIIDSSCYGMGRGVGNLATELITDYINNNIQQRYSLTPVLNIVDKYLMPIYARRRWGYDLPFFLSATFKCHPNYAAHLMQKETLSIEKIEKLLSLIPIDQRKEYDGTLIENLYRSMQSCVYDDEQSYFELRKTVFQKDVVILGPGSSINTYKELIASKCIGKIVISCNFVPLELSIDAVFLSNEKRLHTLHFRDTDQIIVTSNLKDEVNAEVIFDYSSLLGEGDESDNSGAMLIRILKKCGVSKILLAGFDGFDVNSADNYALSDLKKVLDYDTSQKKNVDISRQLTLALNGVSYEFITPTKYKISHI